MHPIYLTALCLTVLSSAGVQAKEKNMGPNLFPNPQLQWSRSLPHSLNFRSEAQALGQIKSRAQLGSESTPDTELLPFKGVPVDQGLVYTFTGVPVSSCADLAVAAEGLAFAVFILNEPALNAAPTNLLGRFMAKGPGVKIDSAEIHRACSVAILRQSGNQASISFLLRKR